MAKATILGGKASFNYTRNSRPADNKCRSTLAKKARQLKRRARLEREKVTICLRSAVGHGALGQPLHITRRD